MEHSTVCFILYNVFMEHISMEISLYKSQDGFPVAKAGDATDVEISVNDKKLIRQSLICITFMGECSYRVRFEVPTSVTSTKFLKNVGNLGKIILATAFEKLPKVQ